MEKGSVNFVDLLTLMFVYLKLTGQVNWSWLIVISPMVFGLLIGLFLMVVRIKLKEEEY